MIKNKISFIMAAIIILSSVGTNNRVYAKGYKVDQKNAIESVVSSKSYLKEDNKISSDVEGINSEELIGVDIIKPKQLSNNGITKKSEEFITLKSSKPLKRTQILSKNQVKKLYKNLNSVNKGTKIIGSIIGIKSPVLGLLVQAGGLQNPNFRKAIKKAYKTNKRLKIVTEYRGSMSLNRVYYYVVN
ncbi:MAG: hypothetical protein Q4B36_07530 [Tissierellia bacterium]|nr:hypothetical protein [Tissierellia bacterium]